MERAVAAVQEMYPAAYQAKVCGQPVHPQTGEEGCGRSAWKGSDMDTHTPLPLGANPAHVVMV